MESNNPGPFIKKAFSPTVLVIANQEVDDMCKKNGLEVSITSVLEACGTTVPASREPVKVRVNLENQLTNAIVIKAMDVKFLTPMNFGAQRPKFQFLLLPPAKVEHFPVIKDAASVTAFQTQYLSSVESGSSAARFTPWFDEYRSKFFKTLGPSAFEQFEHPVLCLVLTTSADINPADTLQRLFDRRATGVQNGLPRYVDTTVMIFHYVLVHNVSGKVSMDDAKKKYAAMEKQFGGATSMVTMNSLAEAEPNEDFEKRKLFLSAADMDTFKRLVRTLVWNQIIPHMERVAQSIFPEVSKERGGLMHKFNLMWGSKFSRKGDDNDPDGLLFEVNSLEFRERRLADWSFMLGEYNVAYRTYMGLADIYKNDGTTVPLANVYRASALEMAANCLCMLALQNANLATQQQWNEIDKLFTESWDSFQRGRRRTWARRAALAHAYWGQYRLQAGSGAALERLILDSSDQLELALLHQQHALACVLRSPPRLRNYAFGLVKAADAFTAGHQFLHAICCYFSAQTAYQGKLWNTVDDYLHFRLARLALVVQRPDLAMLFITELLKNNQQPAHLQNSYLREYLFIFKHHGAKLPPSLIASHTLPSSMAAIANSSSTDNSLSALTTLPVVPIPSISRKIEIHVQDVTGGSSHSSPEWQGLESQLIELMTPPDKRYLLTLKKPSAKTEHLGVVGENVYVDIEFTNPLQVPLQFTDMRLTCHATPSYSAMASGVRRASTTSSLKAPGASGPAVEGEPKVVVNVPAQEAAPQAMWTAESCDKLFGPNETRKVQFTVKPLIEGSITILGVQFKLCGVMEGFRPLIKPQVIKVSSPMPRVDLLLLGLPGSATSPDGTSLSLPTPSTLYVGQHHQTTLRITNTGQKPLFNLAFSTSHPQIFLSQQFEEDLSLPHKWAARISLNAGPLQPDQSIDIPLTIRPTTEGTQSYQLLVYYEPVSAGAPVHSSSDIKYRLTRATVTLKVVKSLKVSASIRPDPASIDQYLLAVEIDNLSKLKTKTGAVIAIRSLRITCPRWRPLLLDTTTGEPNKDVLSSKVVKQSLNAASDPPLPLENGAQSQESRNLSPPHAGISTNALAGSPSSQDDRSPSPFSGESRPASRAPLGNKMSLHSTTSATSYSESACMRPEALETILGGDAKFATVLPPRHATTLLFRLVRKSPTSDDFDIVNNNVVFSQTSNRNASSQSNFAAYLSQESIIARRNAAPKRSALFDSRTPEELEEAKRIHTINELNNVSLLVTWDLASDEKNVSSNLSSSSSLSALSLHVPSANPGTSKGGNAVGQVLSSKPSISWAASHNVFDVPFLPTTPWMALNPASTRFASASGSNSTSESGDSSNNNSDEVQCPVRVCLSFSSVIRHSFNAQGVLFVPITFQVLNTSPFTAVSLVFEALKPSETMQIPKTKKRSHAALEEARAEFMWVGKTLHEIVRLAPESTTTFTLQACFPFAGKFNLNRWRFWVSPEHHLSRRVGLYARSQHLISILNDSSLLVDVADPATNHLEFELGKSTPLAISEDDIGSNVGEPAYSSAASVDIQDSQPSDTDATAEATVVVDDGLEDRSSTPASDSLPSVSLSARSLGSSVVQDVDLADLSARTRDAVGADSILVTQDDARLEFVSQDLAASLARSTLHQSNLGHSNLSQSNLSQSVLHESQHEPSESSHSQLEASTLGVVEESGAEVDDTPL